MPAWYQQLIDGYTNVVQQLGREGVPTDPSVDATIDGMHAEYVRQRSRVRAQLARGDSAPRRPTLTFVKALRRTSEES